jgi:hypothetical protein
MLPIFCSDSHAFPIFSSGSHAFLFFPQFLMNTVLSSTRVSAQSLGLACITSAVEINPHVMTSLDPISRFLVAHDPKLRSGVAKVNSHHLCTLKPYLILIAVAGNINCCPIAFLPWKFL